eukprot:763289-Hanusia_phi.AAC.4
MSVQIAMNWRVCDKSSEWTMWEVGEEEVGRGGERGDVDDDDDDDDEEEEPGYGHRRLDMTG